MGSCLSQHSANAPNVKESGIVNPSSAEYAASLNPLHGFSGSVQPTNVPAPLNVIEPKTIAAENTPRENSGVCEEVVEQPLVLQKDQKVQLQSGDVQDHHEQQAYSFPDEQRKLVCMRQDSQTSAYSNAPAPDSPAASVLPALPQNVQCSSPTATPPGNVLMQLSRETILRNRMCPGAVPSPSKPASARSHEPQPEPLEASATQTRSTEPPHHFDDNAGAAPALVVSHSSLGTDNLDDSFDRSNLVAAGPVAAVGCPSSAVGAPAAPHPRSLGTVTDSFLTGGGLSFNGSELGGTLRGLGVEAALGEMQQMMLIGSGGGGCVYSGRWRGVTAAIKFIVSSTDDQLVRSQREALLSLLASHPHVVQTYATSVTQLTEQMLAMAEATPADVRNCGNGERDPNISHETLASLTTGSWIKGELHRALHSNGAVSGLASVAGVPLSTIHEGIRGSSTGSASASFGHQSGKGGQHRAPLAGGGASAASEMQSEGQGSGSSASRTRGQEGPGPAGGSGLVAAAAAAAQMAVSVGITGTSSMVASCHTSATDSDLGAATGRMLQAFHGTVPPACSAAALAGLGMGPWASPAVSADTATTAEMLASPSHPQNSSGGGRGTGAGGCYEDTCSAGEEAAAATEKPPEDSFYSSHVRDDLGRIKYSIPEVLRHMGARAGQFLTMVVMEYCDGGSLLAALKEGPFHRETTLWSPRMLLRSIIRTALDVAHGMQHLHLSGLVHGDLKPGNVLLKGSNQDKRTFVAKVSDLGTAHPLGTAEEMSIDDTQMGSVAYMAPEVFRGRIMKASDVYSFGVLLWQMTCGTGAAPYEGAHPIAIMLGVSEAKMSLRWPPGVFRPMQQLGELCLHVDPACRPSFKSVVGALEKLERHMQRLAVVAGTGSGSGGGSSYSAATGATPFGGGGMSTLSPVSSQNAMGSLQSSMSGPALVGSPAITGITTK